MRKLFSWLFLITGIVIGLGSIGHTLAVSHVHAALDKFPVDPNVSTMIYVVWYFVSACMLLFGLTLVWVWLRLRAGDTKPLFVAVLIGLFNLANGIGGMIYRHGDPFFWFFIVLGGLLLISSYVLR
ncbi:MAG: hypothetical protein WBY73_04765, partial [Candidatus Acidiferrales bacterium]